MIDRNTPSDPRLRERRGDLVGRNALLFTVLVVAAFAALIWGLLGFLPAGTDSTRSPSGSPVGGTESPSASPSAASPSVSIAPSPSIVAPSIVAPSPSGDATVGEPFELVVEGTSVGTVTVQAPDFRRRVRREEAPGKRRWTVVEVTYQATAELSYDASQWSVEDEDGATHEWAGTDPKPPLGTGTLAAGEEVTGFVSFHTPARKDVVRIVLSREAGGPLVFQVP